jgi:hypothetical protein
MTDLHTAAAAALAYMDQVGQMDMYPEEWAVAEALRAALAEPQGEPVAWMGPGTFISHAAKLAAKPDGYAAMYPTPLYAAAPPQVQPTDAELAAKGWQRVVCPACGSEMARAAPPQVQPDGFTPISDLVELPDGTVMHNDDAPQVQPLTDDPWRSLYRRAINEANGLTNYVEDRPELRGAERRIGKIEDEARALAHGIGQQEKP